MNEQKNKKPSYIKMLVAFVVLVVAAYPALWLLPVLQCHPISGIVVALLVATGCLFLQQAGAHSWLILGTVSATHILAMLFDSFIDPQLDITLVTFLYLYLIVVVILSTPIAILFDRYERRSDL